MGTECHTVFECLLKPRHKRIYDEILTAPATIRNSKSVTRHVQHYMKKCNLPEECFDKIDAMIVVGLGADFFCEGGTLLEPEYEFTIENENPKYIINGLIDKPVMYGKFIRIADYKSSKKKFEGDELKVNVQAMMYSLAAKKLWPHVTPIVDFIFLQFPEDPLQRLRFSQNQLDGFEWFLSDVYTQMASFNEKAAMQNLAAKQKMPGKGEGFKGPLVCGFAKEKGQLKKDGTVMWHCSFKFPFEYYALCNEEGDVVKSSFKDDLKPKTDKGEFVVKKKYKGCPHFIKKSADYDSFL